MKITVVGGGAAGLTAAAAAAERGAKVTILEHKDRIGKKLLLTGNGRCNLTNTALQSGPEKSYPFGDRELLSAVFRQFSYDDTIRFFEEAGIHTKNRGALIYPYSDEAGAVVNAFLRRLRFLGVKIVTDCGIKRITALPAGGFSLDTDKGNFEAERLILACGGRSYPKTGSDGSGFLLAESLGHTVHRPMPGLVKLTCGEPYFKSIAGVRMHAVMTLKNDGSVIFSEEGELQLTERGISGIAVMNLSNRLFLCNGKAEVSIDLLPELSKKEVQALLRERAEVLPGEMTEFFTGLLPKKLGALFLRLADIRGSLPVRELPEEKRAALAALLKAWTVTVDEPGSFEEAQITLGGVDPSELHKTLESRLVPGLFFAGEMIDLHGDCGGFNLQLAWSTGAAAGKNAALSGAER